MKRLFLPLLLLGALSLTLNSCKKEETDTETQSAVDNSICEGEFTRVMPTVNSFAISEGGVHRQGFQGLVRPASSCPVISVINPNQFPNTKLIIDYGTVGCVDTSDGKTRKGKIEATFSESWDSTGTVVTINLVDYYVNNIKYEGTVTITRNSMYSYTIDVANGKCSNPNWVLTWESTRTFTQTGGTNTPLDPADDVFEASGSANGVNRDGKAYTVNITKNLVKRQVCSWIESGTVELTPEGLATRTVDFGDGTCDNKATLTINGNTFSFTMN
jgi:hypothetical protein